MAENRRGAKSAEKRFLIEDADAVEALGGGGGVGLEGGVVGGGDGGEEVYPVGVSQIGVVLKPIYFTGIGLPGEGRGAVGPDDGGNLREWDNDGGKGFGVAKWWDAVVGDAGGDGGG